MKLSKFKCLMGTLAMTVQQSQLDELKAISNLSEWEKGEARSCIKLLLLLRRKLATDMDLVEELLGLFEGIPTMTSLYTIVKQFKQENASLDEEQASSNDPSNGPLSLSSVELSQKDAFKKMLLRISQSLSWSNLEIMIALSPTPEGSKERLSMGIHLFEEMKTYGCINEKDVELLQCLFKLLNLKGPMDILQEYMSEFFTEPSAPPPSLPYHYGAGMPPESLPYNPPFSNPSLPSLGYVPIDYRYPLSHRPGSQSQSTEQQTQAARQPSNHSLSVPQTEEGPGEQSYYQLRKTPSNCSYPLSHGPGSQSQSTEQQSEQTQAAQQNPPTEPSGNSLPILQTEEGHEEQSSITRVVPNGRSVEGVSPKRQVQSFPWGSSTSHSSMTSVKSANSQHGPVNVSSNDRGVTAYPTFNPTPQQISTSSPHATSTHPPSAAANPTTHSYSAATSISSVSRPGSSSSIHSNPSSTVSGRMSGSRRKGESSSAEMLPPSKRPRSEQIHSYSELSMGSISYPAQVSGHFLTPQSEQGQPTPGQSLQSEHNTNTELSTGPISYSAEVSGNFFTPQSEQGQPTPGQSLQSEENSVPSYPADPPFPHPIENPSLQLPPARSAPPQRYAVEPPSRGVERLPNIMPNTRASQLSASPPSIQSSSSVRTRGPPYTPQPRQAASLQRSEGGNIITSPESGDQNVDLQNPTGGAGVEDYHSMSSLGGASLAPTESTLESYSARSISFSPFGPHQHTGGVPRASGPPGGVPRASGPPGGVPRASASGYTAPSNQGANFHNPSHGAEMYSNISSLGSIEASQSSYQAGSLPFSHPEQRQHTEEHHIFVAGATPTPATGGEEESMNEAAGNVRGVPTRLYPDLTQEENMATGNAPSEGSSFTAVSSQSQESNETASSTLTETSGRKRPHTRSQKDKEEDEQSSTSKRQKTTTASKRKGKVSSKNLKSSKPSEKVKIKAEKKSLPSKFLSYLWPFGSKETEENEQQQSGEDNPEGSGETEEAQTSDSEYELANEGEDPSSN